MDARSNQKTNPPMQDETLADFAKSILTAIESIPPETSGDVFVRVESSVSIERLTGLLNSLTSIEKPLSAELLQVLQNFLYQRYVGICKTDAIYPHHPTSKINRVCLLLAQKIALYCDKHPYELLMPTAIRWMDYFPRHTADSLRLNEFIMGDRDTPLPILDAFALIEHEFDPLPVPELEHVGFGKKLTLNEEKLLSKHSAAAGDYYRVLRSRSSKPQEKEAAKNRFIEFMSSMDASFIPQSNYDVSGKRKLAQLIMHYVGDRKKLVALFAHTIPVADWRDFQSGISDTDYFRLMGCVDIQKSPTETESDFNARRFQKIDEALNILLYPPDNRALTELNDILLVVEDIEHKKAALRAYLYCLLQMYHRARNLLPESKPKMQSYKWGAYAASFFQLGCTKEEKLLACDAIAEILIEQTTLVDILRGLESDGLRLHKEAIQQGQLGKCLMIIKDAVIRAQSLEDPARRLDWVRTVSAMPQK